MDKQINYIKKALQQDPICLYKNKEEIDTFYNQSIDTKHSNALNSYQYKDSISFGSAFYRKLIDRLANAYFTRFPSYKSKDNKVINFLDSNKEELTKTFKKAIKEYCLYGSACLTINEELKLESFSKELYLYGDVLVEKGKLTEDALASIKELGIKEILQEQGITLKQDEEQEILIAYYNNKKYMLIENACVELEFANSDSSLSISRETALVNYIYTILLKLEYLHEKYLKAHNSIKNTVLHEKHLKNEVQKYFNDDFNVIEIASANAFNSDITSLFQYVSNAPIHENIKVLEERIEALKMQAIDLLDMQDLFTVEANPNETVEAAANRVAVSAINIESESTKVNDFIERSIKYYLAFKLEIPVSEIDLELDAVSILQEEQKEAKKQASVQRAIELTNLAANSSPALATFYYTLLDEIIETSNFNNDLKEALNLVKQEQMQAKQDPNAQAMQQQQAQIQEQATALELQDKQTDIAKKQAEITKIESETQNKLVETELKPAELSYKQQEQDQQDLDTAIKATEKGII